MLLHHLHICHKIPLLYLSVASLHSFGIVHGNEYLIQKVKRIACAFLEISLSCIIMDSDERQFAMSILSDTRLSTVPRALLQTAFDLVNLPAIAARCP